VQATKESAIGELLESLKALDAKSHDAWMAELNDRKKAEMDHADLLRGGGEGVAQDTFEELKSNKKFYSTVQKSRAYTEHWIRTHSSGRVVLDYACGNGNNAMTAADAGAELAIGLDISPVSIENARNEAARRGLDNTFFVQGDCENTGLPDECVDAVICSGMLHHLDLSHAFPELRRIMKPGAVLLAIEALDYNPVIKAYRQLTPHLRTEWEKAHILSLKDVRFAERFFDVRNVKYWHLFSIGATLFRKTPFMDSALALGNALDTFILGVPGVQRLAWMFTFELHKRAG
jgi:SAM-dependent methyltransferase